MEDRNMILKNSFPIHVNRNTFLYFDESDATFHNAYKVDSADLAFVVTDFYVPHRCEHPISKVKVTDGYIFESNECHRLYTAKKMNCLL